MQALALELKLCHTGTCNMGRQPLLVVPLVSHQNKQPILPSSTDPGKLAGIEQKHENANDDVARFRMDGTHTMGKEA